MRYSGNSKLFDLPDLLNIFYVTARSGLLFIEGDSFSCYCYFWQGHCIFSGHQRFDEFILGDLINLLADNREVINEIKVFSKSHPHLFMEALKVTGIKEHDLIQQLSSITQKTLFESFMQIDIDYLFEDDEEIISTMTSDRRLQEILRKNMLDVAISLCKSPISHILSLTLEQKEDVVESAYNKTLNIFILSAIDGTQTVLQVIEKLQDFDAYFIYDGIINLEREGIISFKELPNTVVHDPLPGMDTIIKTTIEIFQSVIPLICEDTLQASERSEDHPLERTLARIKSRGSPLFSKIEKFTDLEIFLQQVETILQAVEPQKKLILLRQELNVFLVELMLQMKLLPERNSNKQSENYAKGFLYFIMSQGSSNHQQIAKMVGDLFVLANTPVNIDVGTPIDERDKQESDEGHIRDLLEKGLILEAYDETIGLLSQGRIHEDQLYERIISEVMKFFQAEIGDKNTILQRSTHVQAMYSSTDVDADDGFILSRFDEPLTIAQVILMTNMKEHVAYRHIYKLLRQGFIEKYTPPERDELLSIEPESAAKKQEKEFPDRQQQDHMEKDNILSALQQQLRIFREKLPHELFSLTPESKHEDFEKKFNELKTQFDPHNYNEAIRSDVIPLLDKINNYLDGVAQTVSEYYSLPTKEKVVNDMGNSSDYRPDAEDVEADDMRDYETVIINQESLSESINHKKDNNHESNRQHEDHDDYEDEESEPLWKRLIREKKADTSRMKRQEESQMLYQKAIKARDNGNFDESAEFLEQAIKINPSNYALHSTLESVKIQQEENQALQLSLEAKHNVTAGKHNKAVKLFKKAIERDHTRIEYYLELADILTHHLQNYREAEYYYRKASEMEPGNSLVYVSLGRLYKEQGMLKEAREQFNEALRWNKKDTEAKKELKLLP